MHSLLLALLFAAAAPKMALIDFVQGEGIDQAAYRALIDTLAGELRSRGGVELITPSEIKTLLSQEEQKQMLGCKAESCFVELGGALGASLVLTGSVSKTGQSTLLFVKTVHAKRVGEVKQVSRRLKNASVDDLLDAIPGVVTELMGGAAPGQPTQAPAGKAFDPQRAYGKRPFADEAVRNRLMVYGDGAGHFVLAEPKTGLDTVIFWGTAQGLYQQRLESLGRNGAQRSFVFWDARYPDGGMRQLLIDPDGLRVRCREDTRAFKLLTAKELAPLGKTPLFQALVPHRARALAVNDQGVYYYVDRDTRAPQGTGFRLFVGTKGKFQQLELDDVIEGDAQTTFVSAAGRLTVDAKHAEWTPPGGGKQSMNLMNLYLQEPKVFSAFGLYPSALETPCDGATLQ